MKSSLFWFYVVGIPISLLNLLYTIFQPISNIIWLLTPLIAPIIISVGFIFTRTVPIRDFIKACNDTVLFCISCITTAILIFKTINLPQQDPFEILMTNRVGYLLVCIYTILFAIKASIAFSESVDKFAALKTTPSASK
ncbi:hypothetical protein [Pantoea vagans]|uniref:hypothetical protein n=1 Tax=Pantoea vagans TaxID=470934 RepID=UPI00320B8F0F